MENYSVFEWVRAILALIGVISLLLICTYLLAKWDERIERRKDFKRRIEVRDARFRQQVCNQEEQINDIKFKLEQMGERITLDRKRFNEILNALIKKTDNDAVDVVNLRGDFNKRMETLTLRNSQLEHHVDILKQASKAQQELIEGFERAILDLTKRDSYLEHRMEGIFKEWQTQYTAHYNELERVKLTIGNMRKDQLKEAKSSTGKDVKETEKGGE